MDMILQKIKINKIRYLKGILCCILSFFLAMACVALSVLVILDTGLLPGTMQRVLVSSNYYDNLQKDLYRKTEMMTVPTGLSPDVLKEVFLRDEIIREVDGFINASIQGIAYQTATNSVASRLEYKIESFLRQEEVGLDPERQGETGLSLERQGEAGSGPEQKENIEEYIASVIKEYEGNICCPLLGYFCALIGRYQIFRAICWLLCVGFLALCLVLLKRLNQSRTHFMQYMYYSTTAWSWMLLLLPGILLLFKPYSAIGLYPQYINEFTLQYITILLQKLLSAGMAAMLFSFLILLSERGKEAYGKASSPGRLQEN